MSASTYPIRVDDGLKEGASKVAAFYGFDLASVTRALWKQMVRTNSIPLTLTSEEPNDESLRSIQETDEIISAHLNGTRKPCGSAEDMFDRLGM